MPGFFTYRGELPASSSQHPAPSIQLSASSSRQLPTTNSQKKRFTPCVEGPWPGRRTSGEPSRRDSRGAIFEAVLPLGRKRLRAEPVSPNQSRACLAEATPESRRVGGRRRTKGDVSGRSRGLTAIAARARKEGRR